MKYTYLKNRIYEYKPEPRKILISEKTKPINKKESGHFLTIKDSISYVPAKIIRLNDNKKTVKSHIISKSENKYPKNKTPVNEYNGFNGYKGCDTERSQSGPKFISPIYSKVSPLFTNKTPKHNSPSKVNCKVYKIENPRKENHPNNTILSKMNNYLIIKKTKELEHELKNLDNTEIKPLSSIREIYLNNNIDNNNTFTNGFCPIINIKKIKNIHLSSEKYIKKFSTHHRIKSREKYLADNSVGKKLNKVGKGQKINKELFFHFYDKEKNSSFKEFYFVINNIFLKYTIKYKKFFFKKLKRTKAYNYFISREDYLLLEKLKSLGIYNVDDFEDFIEEIKFQNWGRK